MVAGYCGLQPWFALKCRVREEQGGQSFEPIDWLQQNADKIRPVQDRDHSGQALLLTSCLVLCMSQRGVAVTTCIMRAL